jgi:hypothetical protein
MHRPARIASGPRRRKGGNAPVAAFCLLGAALLAWPALGQPLTVPLPEPLPSLRLMTLLVGLHLIGLCFGLGGATMLDFWILRWMRWGSLPGEIARIFLFVSKVVSVGIALLWISGLGFLATYAWEAPEKLHNPKLWAKVTVVIVLTLNGLVIHAHVLPGVLRDVSRPMLDGISGARTGIFLVSGAVSGVSWYTAFALGLMRELNGTVSATLLLGLWATGMVAASLGAYMLWLHLREWSARRRGAPAPVPGAPSPDARGGSPDAEHRPGRRSVPGSQIVPVFEPGSIGGL